MRLFFISIFALVMFVLPVKADVDIDWESATVEDIKEAVKANENVDDKFLTQLLTQACAKSRNIDIIDELIRLGAKIDKKVIHNVYLNSRVGKDFFTLLKQGDKVDKEALNLAYEKQVFLMKKLFENRIDKDVVPNFDIEEWWIIANLQDIQKETDSGIDVNKDGYNGLTPLETVLMLRKNYDIVKFLIDKGADVNGDFGFMPPLRIAVVYSPFEIIELLLKSGARVSGQELIWLVDKERSSEKEEVIDLLLKYGADVNEKRSDGWTVLESSLAGGNIELAKWWIKKGANVPKDILAREWIYTNKTTPEVIDFLITQGADVNAEYHERYYNEYVVGMPLIFAVKRSVSLEVIEKLLKSGAKVNAENYIGKTALSIAREEGNEDVEDLLIKYGAK